MGDTTIISICNLSGDEVRVWQINKRATKCLECGKTVESGHGFRRYTKRVSTHQGGFICGECVGAFILAQKAFMYSTWQATLTTFDGIYSAYPIDAAALAQAWADHGASGLRFAAETLREQARADFLNARNIPFTPKQVNLPIELSAEVMA